MSIQSLSEKLSFFFFKERYKDWFGFYNINHIFLNNNHLILQSSKPVGSTSCMLLQTLSSPARVFSKAPRLKDTGDYPYL